MAGLHLRRRQWAEQQNAENLLAIRASVFAEQYTADWEPLPTGAALIDFWRGRLRKATRLILETLTRTYPNELTKEEVATGAGYEANGGGFNNALGG